MNSIDINSISENEEVNADTHVLLTTIEGMMNVINTQANLYNDIRKKLVEEHLKKPTLEISNSQSFCVECSYQELGHKLSILGSRLKQLKEERENTQEQTEKAFKQLEDENFHLREELFKLRNLLYSNRVKHDNM